MFRKCCKEVLVAVFMMMLVRCGTRLHCPALLMKRTCIESDTGQILIVYVKDGEQ